jgi:hypothetical protein
MYGNRFEAFSPEDFLRYPVENLDQLVLSRCPRESLQFSQEMKPFLANISLTQNAIARFIDAHNNIVRIPEFTKSNIQSIVPFAIGEVFEDLELPWNKNDILNSRSNPNRDLICYLNDSETSEFLRVRFFDLKFIEIISKKTHLSLTDLREFTVESIPSDCYSLIEEFKKYPTIVDFINRVDSLAQ